MSLMVAYWGVVCDYPGCHKDDAACDGEENKTVVIKHYKSLGWKFTKEGDTYCSDCAKKKIVNKKTNKERLEEAFFDLTGEKIPEEFL